MNRNRMSYSITSRQNPIDLGICILILTLWILTGCTLKGPLSHPHRASLEQQFSQHSQTICQPLNALDSLSSSSENSDSKSSIKSTLDLLNVLFLPFKELSVRLDNPTGLEELKKRGVLRIKNGKVGDLVLFYSLPPKLKSSDSTKKIIALEVAVITKVLGNQFYQLCAYHRSRPTLLRMHLDYPHFRRYKDEILNSYIRTVHPSDLSTTAYLAGERFLEFRAFF